jgi:hypothetical protein
VVNAFWRAAFVCYSQLGSGSARGVVDGAFNLEFGSRQKLMIRYRARINISLGQNPILFSAPRMTILSASPGGGRCNAFASSHGARIQASRSSSVVRITGMALAWIGFTTANGQIVSVPNATRFIGIYASWPTRPWLARAGIVIGEGTVGSELHAVSMCAA